MASSRRAYRSQLRARQAEQTRQQILEAAAGLFAERGYAATSLAEIGRRAEVSTESVAAHGPKRELLVAAVELLVDDREAEQLAEVCRRDEVAEVLDGLAGLVLAGRSRSVGIWRALGAAAAGDQLLAETYDALSSRHREGARTVARMLADRGLARTDRQSEELADVVALLSGFDPYQLLVREYGWSPQQFRDWYVEAVRRLVLQPEA